VVSTDKTSSDFNNYETFDFYQINNSSDSPYMDDLKAAIVDELQQKGYRQESQPDLLINIGTNVEEKVQTRETDYRDIRYMGQRNYNWQSEEVIVNQYREGTVVLDFVDADSQELVWQGVGAGTVSGKESAMLKRIQKGVRMLLEDFPVRD
jgi:hypothetical protein